VPDKGGETAVVSTGLHNPELCDLSPVTGAMLLRDLVRPRDNNNPVYVKPLNGPARRVGNLLAYEAAWYPDGRRILVSFNEALYATDERGESLRRLFSVPGNAFWIKWSPHGKRLRFTAIDTASEATSLWEANADGTALHKLFPNVSNQLCCGSWTPDGRFYLFQARVGNTFQIWAERNRDGSLLPIQGQPFPLISGAPSYRSPLASQDGRRLFVRAEAPRGELVKYDAHIGEFISILPSISARTITFSSDTNWFAYTSVADNNLWRCRADGTDCLELTEGFKQTVLPSWSPDGRTIAFMGIHFTGDWGLYSVPANGGTIRPLVQSNEAMGYPDWSPDGRQLVFSEVPPVSKPKGIYLMDIPSPKISTIPESSDFSYPRWSPNGRFLVAQHSGDLNLYLFDFTSAKWRLLAGMAANYPEWSRDSRYVYFLSERSASRAIFRVSMASLGIEKVASLNGVERPPFFMGDWIGMAPDGSPIAIRNATIEDIYAWNLIAR
jgi:Tol biopolymer transport system component